MQELCDSGPNLQIMGKSEEVASQRHQKHN
jgi:hypothetical protein